MAVIRPAAVAGLFYPDAPEVLARDVARLLAPGPENAEPPPDGRPPKAVIAPHAGYVYSGALAGAAYRRLARGAKAVRRVVLLGPVHRVPVRGLATTSADFWETPLGRVAIDTAARDRALDLAQVAVHDRALAREHSLEVHLPFLRHALPGAALVPFAVGEASAQAVAEVIDLLWGGDETRIVVSSDLSHYLDDAAARALDARTAAAIERLDEAAIGRDQACGRVAIHGLLRAARGRGLTVERIGLMNSGDSAGPKDRVVGYGAWTFA